MPAERGQRTHPSGALSIDAEILSSRQIFDVSQEMVNIEMGSAYNLNDTPLIVILKNLKGATREVTNAKFNVYEDTLLERDFNATAISGGGTGTAITFSTANAAYMNPGDILLNTYSEERAYIKAVDYATGICTVVRDLGTFLGGAAAWTTTHNVVLIGGTAEEGSNVPESVDNDPQLSYNYTMRLKTPLSMSDLVINGEFYPNTSEKLRRTVQLKKMIEHKFSIEQHLLMSVRSAFVGIGGKAVRTTGGILQHLQGNVINVSTSYGGVVTPKAFDAWCEQLFENGSQTRRWVFGGSRLLSILASWGRSIQTITSKTDTFGLTIKKYESAQGELWIVPHRKLFRGTPGATGGALASTAIALDLDGKHVKYVYFRNLDTKLHTDVEIPGTAGIVDCYETEFGLHMTGHGLDNSYVASSGRFRSAHGKMTNINSY